MGRERLDPRRCAVLVIDMARDFVEPGGTIAEAGGAAYRERAAAVVPPLRRLLAAARRAGATVVYATDSHEPGDPELRKWPPHAMRGTRWAEIVPELSPESGDVVLGKRTYSPFHGTELEAILRERGIGTLLITGLHTDCCCRHASGDAFQKGYDLVWVTDTLQAFTPEAHEAGLRYFRDWYATDPEEQFKTADAVIAAWSGRRPRESVA